MIHFVRLLFVIFVIAVSITFGIKQASQVEGETLVALFIVIPAMIASTVVLIDMFWKRKRLQVMSGLFLGVIVGLIFGYMCSYVIDMLIEVFKLTDSEIATFAPILKMTKIVAGGAAIYFSVSFILQTRDDFRFIIPYVEFQKETRGPRVGVLDTSVIIDGRIADLAQTKVFESELIVPKFVLEELQTIADSSDKLKRNRGRRGLDILNKLQTNNNINIRILESNASEVLDAGDVDAKLVVLTRLLHGRLVTNDFNLNKVAQLSGVEVININDIANAMKPMVLPGESFAIKIIKPGEEAGQGIGYLDDGTMVVIEQGRDFIGRQINITVTSALQTSAGRMIFGKVEDGEGIAARRVKTDRKDNPYRKNADS